MCKHANDLCGGWSWMSICIENKKYSQRMSELSSLDLAHFDHVVPSVYTQLNEE